MSAGKQLAIFTGLIAGIIAATSVFGANPDEAAPLAALARMPVKEVTVFKDGHVFVVHEGKMPVDAAGNVVMDYLPAPIMGTFWPYSNEKNGKLSAVVASQRRVLVERNRTDHTRIAPGERRGGGHVH